MSLDWFANFPSPIQFVIICIATGIFTSFGEKIAAAVVAAFERLRRS